MAKFKKLKSLLAIPLLFSPLTSCISNESKFELQINGNTFQVQNGDVNHLYGSFLDDDAIKIGVVSDIEGAVTNAVTSAEKLKRQNVDAVILAGDNYENEQLRGGLSLYPNSTNNLEEMVNGITPYAELGVPVFVIPGNHESQEVYTKSINKLRESFPNVFDIKYNVADLKGVNIVGMGGYHHPKFTVSDGYLLEKEDYENAAKYLKKLQRQSEPNIFVTHGPPLSTGKIDYIHGVGNVGDRNTTAIMKSDLVSIVNVHGHIHESGRSQIEYGSGISINTSSITEYMNGKGPNTGLITISDGNVKYSNLK